jgi:pimeloyl-ACP methyl ester carboxylesterase
MPGPSSGSGAVATRIDTASGAREEVEFLGGSERVFACLHVPPSGAEVGLLICSPVASEFEKNYRRETLLAWALASRGIAVGRFHYRGVGHSDGEAADVSIERMIEDAEAATEHLVDRTGVTRVAFLGTRVGALVAGAMAGRRDRAPLALWEPVLDGSQYFREVFRAGFMADLRLGGGAAPSEEEVVARLRSEGRIDVVGYTVGSPLYESAVSRSLEAELDGPPRPVLMVQLSQSQNVRPPYRALADRLTAFGFQVDVQVIDEVEAWWFGEERRGKAALTQATVDWVTSKLGVGAAA